MESGLSSLPDDEEVLHSSVSVDFGESLDFQQHPAVKRWPPSLRWGDVRGGFYHHSVLLRPLSLPLMSVRSHGEH